MHIANARTNNSDKIRLRTGTHAEFTFGKTGRNHHSQHSEKSGHAANTPTKTKKTEKNRNKARQQKRKYSKLGKSLHCAGTETTTTWVSSPRGGAFRRIQHRCHPKCSETHCSVSMEEVDESRSVTDAMLEIYRLVNKIETISQQEPPHETTVTTDPSLGCSVCTTATHDHVTSKVRDEHVSVFFFFLKKKKNRGLPSPWVGRPCGGGEGDA